MIMRISVGAAVSLMVAAAPLSGQTTLSQLLTVAERTEYAETSRYDDVMAFLQTVADASPRIHLTSFGRSFEGRALPLVVVGDVSGPTPEAVRATGKTRVFVQANIHAGEVCGKEAMQMLLRDVARGDYAEWFDSLVLVIAPIYNVDGNERVRLNNRPRQHGPIAGMGQRPNALGYDLNRDHIKLDAPEARALVNLMDRYDPHVGIDLHTTNGTRHGYHLTYSPPLHPNTDPALMTMVRGEWLPAAQAYLRDATGWESYYYGNASRRGEPGWYTFDHRPRFNNNYVGLRNRFAILSEAYSYATFRDRVEATLHFVVGAVRYAHRNATAIARATDAADRQSLVGTSLAVRAAPERSVEPVDILMGEVAEETNPRSGEVILRRLDETRIESMFEYGTFAATETERVPAAYFVPREARRALEKLAAHGVAMESLDNGWEGTVEEFRIDSTSVGRPFQQHRERTVFGAYREVARELPAGTVLIRMNQPLARLVFTLLEPRSDDGLLNWNVFDDVLNGREVYPVVRVHQFP